MSHSSTMSHHHSKLSPAQRAGWMPRDLAALGHFLDHIIDKVEEEAWTKVVEQRKAAKGKTWQDSVHELQELLERDSCARMLLHRAIDQAPRDLVDQANFLTSTEQLLRVIDHIITTAPVYAHDLLVGFPLNALLALLMGTPAGEEAFRHPELNRKFKGILDEWCRFLDSKASRYTLQTWLTDEAVVRHSVCEAWAFCLLSTLLESALATSHLLFQAGTSGSSGDKHTCLGTTYASNALQAAVQLGTPPA